MMTPSSDRGHGAAAPKLARQPVMHSVSVLLLLGVYVAAGCTGRHGAAWRDASGTPARGGRLEIVGGEDVDHLSTTSAYSAASSKLFRAIARQLLAYPPAPDYATKTRPAPDLALEVPTEENGGISADGRTYIFHLRHGIRWDASPPREVTAYDIVRGFKLFCNPVSPVGAPTYYTGTIAGMDHYCDRFARVPRTVAAIREFVTTQDLEGIRAVDASTVVFRLEAPTPDFLNLVALTFASPVPAEYLDYLPDGPAFREHTVSIGPYRIERYSRNREILLERNPVWDVGTDPIRPAYVDGIRVRLGMDSQLAQLQIEAGAADLRLGGDVPAAELASLLAMDDPTVWLSPSDEAYCCYAFLAVNFVGPNNAGALKRPDVRRAIAVAVDKAALVQLAGGSRVARPLRQAFVSSVSGWRLGADQYVTPRDRGDAVTARTLLAEARYPAGVALRLAYSNARTWSTLAAQSLQASFKRARIELQLLPVTEADLAGRLLSNPENAKRGEWDLALGMWSIDWFSENNGRFVIPGYDSRFFGQNTLNYGGYSSPEVDGFFDRATTARSAALAEEAWFDAARRLMGDVALVPLIEYKRAFARSRRVRNCTWDVLGLDCDLTSVWLADAAPKADAK